MIVLVIRTDKPEAEISIYNNDVKIAYESWQAHRELAETIHHKINEILNKLSKSIKDIKGIVIYRGPGSFTGLRIGFSVANSLAYSLQAPIIATGGDDWISDGLKLLEQGKGKKVVLPEYGAEAHITQPRK